jgi:hypothetical protein
VSNPYGPDGNNPYPVYNNYSSYTDKDGVNEAAIAIEALGGPVKLGDTIEADVMDPLIFQINTFTANGVINGLADLVISDAGGDFSFLMFSLMGDMDYAVVEADTLQYARAFVARELKDWNLMQYLLAQKEAYLADSEATNFPCDLNQWGLGEWSMFAYRAPGRLLLRDGSFKFFNARAGYPVEYWDFTLCPAGQEGPDATSWIRYLQVGHNQVVLQGDVLDLTRSTQSPLRVWRKTEDKPKKKGLFGFGNKD